MAGTFDSEIQQAYVAFFNRPADFNGLQYWNDQATQAGGVAPVLAAFGASAEYTDLYAGKTPSTIIETIYQNLFNRAAEPDALSYWGLRLSNGTFDIGQIANAIVTGAQNDDKVNIANKVAAATSFTNSLDTNASIIGYETTTVAGSQAVKAWLKAVTSDAATLPTTESVHNIVADTVVASTGTETPSTTTTLTTGWDNLTGTSGNDTFTAQVVQNVNGEQTNQLATGDRINGGAGNDTLNAVVQAASALNAGPAAGIKITSVSVENALFTALDVTDSTAAGSAQSNTVTINAKDMLGLTTVGSVHSDANLIIQNLTTLQNDGVYSGARNTDSVTVRMDHTGNDAAVDAESDLTVLFDNDYLLSGQSSTDNAYYFLEDREGAAVDAAKPLANIQNDGIQFTVNGVAKTVKITAAQLVAFQETDGTWAGYTALLKGALTLAAQTDTSLKGLEITLSTTLFRTEGLDGTKLPVPAPAIVLSSATSSVDASGFSTSSDAPGQYDVFAVISNEVPTTIVDLVTVNVELYKAGRGAEGGDLTIGGMSTDMNNVWDYSKSAIKEGVERFNISVEGNATQFSSLASLQSTNNTLEEVNVVSKTTTGQTSFADLIIGNHNTVGVVTDALKDVQTFNAAALQGKLTLNAEITTESIAKYINVTDTGVAAADNVDFVYTGSANNDTMNVVIDGAVLASNSSIVVGREDFTFTANGGAGDDNISLTIVNSALTGNADAWYANQALNANVSINGGAGNDTIRTFGAGNVKIDAGSGNDTVYTDNTGASKAVFVLNTANQMAVGVVGTGTDYVLATNAERTLADLQSSANTSTNLYNGAVKITFMGFESTVNVASTGYKTSDLQVNQAIKSAINSDPVLSKLLLATDGPANTLVVTALIDGVHSNDLTNGGFGVSITAPAATTVFSAAELSGLIAAYGLAAGSTSTQVLAAMTANNTDYTAQLAEAGNVELAGANGVAQSDNTINLGAGNDVLVLGTGANSNDKVVFTGYDLGLKSIVNFTADATSAAHDTLDFSSYFNNLNLVTQTTNTDATVEANSTTVHTATFTTTNTFANLTGATLLAAINSTNTGAADYAGLTAATLDAANAYTTTTLVGGIGKAVVMVENNLNLGEYKVFELSFNGTSTNTTKDFTAATLISTVDFGSTVTVDGGGTVVPGTSIVLTPGTTATVAATADVAEVFTFDVAAALALTDNTQIIVSGFETNASATTIDLLTINSITALGATTLDALNGVDGISVQTNVITNETVINFGADANGDVVAVTLTGVSDAALININVI